MKRYLFLKITYDSNISCSTFRCKDMLPSGIEDGRIDNILEVVSYDCKLTYESLNICLYKICISLQNTINLNKKNQRNKSTLIKSTI